MMTWSHRYGSATNNVTSVSQCLTFQPHQDPKVLVTETCFIILKLNDSIETLEDGSLQCCLRSLSVSLGEIAREGNLC